MSIMDKLKQNSKLKATEVLSESKFFNEKDQTQTDVPMVNVALSGSVDGGLSSGMDIMMRMIVENILLNLKSVEKMIYQTCLMSMT